MNKLLFNKLFNERFNSDVVDIVGVNMYTTANKSITETQHHQQFVVNGNSMGYTFGNDDKPERITKSFFASCATFLKRVKIADPTKAVALVLSSTTGEFKFAAIVQYNENKENPDEPGNWSYVTTFNEADLSAIENKRTVNTYVCSDERFKNVFDDVSYDVGGIQFKNERFMYDACMIVIETLLAVLDKEAEENKTVDIDMVGYFTASVETSGDDKTFAITPSGEMKEIIKSDIDL